MTSLTSILPSAGNAACSDGETGLKPNAPDSGAEPFDNLMSRALSPQSDRPAAAPVQPPSANPAGAQEAKAANPAAHPSSTDQNPANPNPVNTSPAATPSPDGKSSPAKTGSSKTTVKSKDSKKSEAGSTQTEVSSKIAEPNVPIDASPNPAASLFVNPPATPVTPDQPNAKAVISEAGTKAAAITSLTGVAKAITGTVLTAGTDAKGKQTPVATDSTVSDSTAKAKMASLPAKSPTTAPIAELKAGQTADLQKLTPVKNLPADSAAAKPPATPVTNPNVSTPAVAGNGDSTGKSPSVQNLPVQNPSGLPVDAKLEPVVIQANSAAQPPASAPVKADGTVVAQQAMTMKKVETTNKDAGQSEKVLPSKPVSSSRESILPGKAISVSGGSVATAPRTAPWENKNVTATASVANDMIHDPSAPEDAAMASSTPELRSQTLNRTHDLVMQSTLRMVESKSDSLQVVLNPGGGTQLSLELRQRSDGIVAEATLQQGNFAHMNQHWPQLQQQLEQRGIKLAPLAGGENATMTDGQGFRQEQRPASGSDQWFGGVATGFAAAGANSGLSAPSAASLPRHQGWETWA